jgi:hypothetical protein
MWKFSNSLGYGIWLWSNWPGTAIWLKQIVFTNPASKKFIK